MLVEEHTAILKHDLRFDLTEAFRAKAVGEFGVEVGAVHDRIFDL
jgi:hypothetical protein